MRLTKQITPSHTSAQSLLTLFGLPVTQDHCKLVMLQGHVNGTDVVYIGGPDAQLAPITGAGILRLPVKHFSDIWCRANSEGEACLATVFT